MAGQSSWVRLIVLSSTGDTLRNADVALSPIERDSTYWISAEQNSMGQYGFGPLKAGTTFLLRVEHRGYQTATRKVSFCKDHEAFFVARLKPTS